MVEWIGVGLGFIVIVGFIGGIILSWNIAKGGIDIMEFFGNAGQRGAGHTKNYISGTGADTRPKEKKKWRGGKMV